jgi:hypothetical protein
MYWVLQFLLPLAGCDDSSQFIQSAGVSATVLLSGSENEYGRTMTQDADGHLIFAGHSNSTDIKTDTTITQRNTSVEAKDYDVVIVKKRPGGGPQASLRLGGDGDDRVFAVATDRDNRIFIAGTTTSRRFPGTGQVPAKTNAFVAIISPDLKQMVKVRIIGGNNHDFGRALTIDTQGSVYLAGSTASTDFPLAQDGYEARPAVARPGNYDIGLDAYILKLSPNLERIVASALIGGGGDEYVYGIARHESYGVYIVGNTNSFDYPATDRSHDKTHNGSVDIFVTRFDTQLTRQLASTYAGWRQYDYGRGISVDVNGGVLVAGYTHNTKSKKISIPGAIQEKFAGGLTDILLLKFDSTLSERMAASFLGGSNDDYATGIIVSGPRIVVIGYTASADFAYRATGARYRSGGGYDIVSISVNKELNVVDQVDIYGGPKNDFAYGVLTGKNAELHIVGNTESSIPTSPGSTLDHNMEMVSLTVTNTDPSDR